MSGNLWIPVCLEVWAKLRLLTGVSTRDLSSLEVSGHRTFWVVTQGPKGEWEMGLDFGNFVTRLWQILRVTPATSCWSSGSQGQVRIILQFQWEEE